MSSNVSAPGTDVRQRILDEAIRLFGTRGFEGTSLQAIADAVGIRKPSLLYHFSSKDELRQAVTDNLIAHWTTELPKLLTSYESEQTGFASIIEALVEYFRHDANRARLAVREMLDRPEQTSALVRDNLGHWVKLLVQYIRMGQKSGIFKPEMDPESYIVQVMMMVIGTVAIGEVAAAILLDSEGDNSSEPRIQELVRIARDTLFVDNANPGKKG